MSSPGDVKGKLPKRVADYFLVIEPESFSFVLTESDGARIYASALVFYEPVAGSGGSAPTLYAPKCLVLTSHWGFCASFTHFLQQLYHGCHQGGLSFPPERLVANFICEVPLPPEGKIAVEYKSLPQALEFKRPPPNQPPLQTFPLSELFRWLSAENLLFVFSAVMCECKILLTATKLQTLTEVAEGLTYLLCPFFWRHIYIPLLPQRLTDYVSAPMPFFCGILHSYLPDSMLLDGVVVVNLDDNAVMSSDSVTIPPLPEKRYQNLLKSLRKVVGDTAQPVKPTIKWGEQSEQEVQAAFLRFHAKVFKEYRTYLEAPSEFVVDRFNKIKFCSNNPEKGPFLTAFMETQMFQCFVDERYQQSDTKARNLEVLFFDEYIDKVHKKATPFLSDTSHDHITQDRVQVLQPNIEGLPGADTHDKLYRFRSWPDLNEDLFHPVRHVAPLVSDTELSSRANSMRFFTEARMYSQHFHSLRVRSAKQDLAFKDIQAYFKSAQAMEETRSAESADLCRQKLDKETMETGSTVDAAWQGLKRYAKAQSKLERDAFHGMRDQGCAAMYATCTAAEQMLRINFDEATMLEKKAAKCKADVERAKAQGLAVRAKYMSVQKQCDGKTLSPTETTRLVNAKSEAEDAILDLDEAETTFQTIIAEYELRMPEIIKTVRRLTSQRIDGFKVGMQKYVAAQRAYVQGLSAALNDLEDDVASLDSLKDLKSFATGTKDFWAMAPMGSAPGGGEMEHLAQAGAVDGDSTSAAAATQRERKESVSSGQRQLVRSVSSGVVDAIVKELPVSYALQFWGPDGYVKVEQQAKSTKNTLKELGLLFEKLASCSDGHGKDLKSLHQQTPAKFPCEIGQARMWTHLRIRPGTWGKQQSHLSALLLKLNSNLSVKKGEIKRSLVRFTTHKTKLEKEVSFAEDAKARAHAVRTRVKDAFEAAERNNRDAAKGSMTQQELERRARITEKMGGELKEAEHHYNIADRNRKAITMERDLGLARILEKFEAQDREAGQFMQHALVQVLKAFDGAVRETISIGEAVKSAVIQINAHEDMRAILAISEADQVDLVTLGSSRAHIAVDIATRGLRGQVAIATLLSDTVVLEEAHIKALRKIPNSIRKKFALQGLGSVFESFLEVIQTMIQTHDQECKSVKEALKVLQQRNLELKVTMKGHERVFQESDKAYLKAESDQEKATRDLSEAENALRLMEIKMQKMDEGRPSVNKGWKSKLLGKKGQIESVKGREEACKREVTKMEGMLETAKGVVKTQYTYRSTTAASQLRKMQSEEEARCARMKQHLVEVLNLHKLRSENYMSVVETCLTKVHALHISTELASWTRSNSTGGVAPLSVRKDLQLRLERDQVAGPSEVPSKVGTSASRAPLQIYSSTVEAKTSVRSDPGQGAGLEEVGPDSRQMPVDSRQQTDGESSDLESDDEAEAIEMGQELHMLGDLRADVVGYVPRDAEEVRQDAVGLEDPNVSMLSSAGDVSYILHEIEDPNASMLSAAGRVSLDPVDSEDPNASILFAAGNLSVDPIDNEDPNASMLSNASGVEESEDYNRIQNAKIDAMSDSSDDDENFDSSNL